MNPITNQILAPYTSLRVGGPAERLYLPTAYSEVIDILERVDEKIWFLGFGSNILVSEKGLPESTIIWRGGEINFDNNQLIVDAGVWWDDAVKAAIDQGLWGLELTSQIPSSVGGAVFGNIAAYGQQVSDTLSWIEVFDIDAQQVEKIDAKRIEFSYRDSSLQQHPHLVILRCGFELSPTQQKELQYDSALIVAEEIGADITTLDGCRSSIIETRRRAGSLYDPDDDNPDRTAGSFFKNPMVSEEMATELAKFDESGKTLERIQRQSLIHGGSLHRASAAHVLLAAGFNRGQTWDKVRLHPSHVLKVQTLEGATAQEVYEVTKLIVETVKQKLDINIEPEVKFLGEF